jgi:hypothetical protein
MNPVINLGVADRLLNAGWLVLMSVNEDWTGSTAVTAADLQALEVHLSGPADLMYGVVRKPKAKHWIFVKRIHQLPTGHVQLTIYTYGAKKTTAPISVDVFAKSYAGFIAARG